MTARDWLALALLGLIWGATYLFNGIAIRDIGPLTIVAARMVIAALALYPLMRVYGLRLPREPGFWWMITVMGFIANVLPSWLIAFAQQSISGGLAAIITSTTPVFAVLLAAVVAPREPLRAGRLAAVLLGVVGVAILVGPEAILGRTSRVLGIVCLVGAAASYAMSGIWGRRFKATQPLTAAIGQIAMAAVISLPVALIVETPWLLPPPTLPVIAAVLGLALICTATGFVLYFRVLASIGATNTALVSLLIPLSANVLGMLILGEILTLRQVAGAAVILSALAVIDGRLIRNFRR